MSTSTSTTPTPSGLKRQKPVREMIGATASAVTAGMVATRDVIQALGFEAKTMKLESYVDYKTFLNSTAEELKMSVEELEALMS